MGIRRAPGIGPAIMKKTAIFLDRDGVLNEVVIKAGKPSPPDSVETLRIVPGVDEALKALKDTACLLIVVTNQPDVARGTTSRKRIDDINHYLMATLPLDDIYVCFHDDSDACACRKPAPGLLLKAQQHYDIDLSSSIMVGDRWKDVAAGAALGVKTVWIDRRYDEQNPEGYDHSAASLIEALPWMMAQVNSV